MELNVVEVDSETRRIALSGRLDNAGVAAIETRFSALVSGRVHGTIVDLTDVTFLASLGIRMLLSSAKAAAGRGGKVVLIAPQPLVEQSLRVTGIAQLIPIAADEARAREILAA